jgi:hypothetical protein
MAGNYSSQVDFRIPQSPPDWLKPELQNALAELYNTVQLIIGAFVNNCGISQQAPSDWTLLATQAPTSTLLAGNLNRLYVQASEAIASGAAISLHNVAGVLQVRNANATNNTKACDGFCTTSTGIAAGSYGEVQLHSGVASIGGLVVGTRYYLSTVNGTISNVAAVAAGNIEQYLGIAITTTQLFFNTHYWVQH